MSYVGNSPVTKATRVLTEGTLASSTQVLNIPGGYTPNNVYVYINGSRLAQNDFTDTDGQTIDLGSELPIGTEFVVEEVRNFIQANHYTKAEIDRLTSSTPLGSVMWAPQRTDIWAGYGVADGQELPRATYPDLWEAVNTGKLPTIDDATWLADPTQRGKYTTGDGSTTFRVPDYNGKSAGAIGGVYLTGDGLKTAAENGLIRDDQMQQITGSAQVVSEGTDIGVGAITLDPANLGPGGYTNADRLANLTFDSANSPDARTGTYTHGVDVSGCWVIRLFGAVVNVGSADAAQLATDYANLAGEVANKLDANSTFGGAAQSWQDVTGSRSGNTTYTNSTGKPIKVRVSAVSTSTGGSGLDVNIDGLQFPGVVSYGHPNGGYIGSVEVLVRNGSQYLVETPSSTILKWLELR